MPVERHKTPRKQFPHRLARRKPRHHIPPPMLQNKNPRQRRTPRRRIHRLPMPGRPIHPHLEIPLVIPSNARDLGFRQLFPCPVILSEVIAPRSGAITQSKDPVLVGSTGGPKRSSHSGPTFIPPHNNPVITQNLNLLPRRPQPRSRALPRPRMPNKQIPHPIPPNNPAPMQLNPLLLRKPMHNQQLVEGIG